MLGEELAGSLEWALGVFAGSTTVGGIVDLLEALWRDLDRWDQWAESNHITLKKAKCQFCFWVVTPCSGTGLGKSG